MKASEILDDIILDNQAVKSTYFDEPKEGEVLLISKKLYDQLCDEFGMIQISRYRGRTLKIAK